MAQTDDRIPYFISLCEKLYNPKSSEEREETQILLECAFPTFADEPGGGMAKNHPLLASRMEALPSFGITTPTGTASSLRILLENSASPYVQTFCLSRLKQLVQAQFPVFSDDAKIQLRAFLLDYAFRHPDLVPFVVNQLASLLALVTLLGWQEFDSYRHIHEDIVQFNQASMDHRIIGMQILAILVQDINPPSFARNLAKFRKSAGRFRDTQLLEICQMALDTFKEILGQTVTYANPGQQDRLKDATLSVLVKCFSYDFNGTSSDDAGEDVGTVQVPATWRPMFIKEDFVSTFFTAYRTFLPPFSSKVMECIVMIASVRKSLFTTHNERSAFVLALMDGAREIMLTSQGMNDADNYNGFCRFLYRFRSTAPLNELAEKAGYLDWIQLVANFSLQAFQSWKWAPNTAMYILGFWSRIVQSMTYYHQLGEGTVQKLESITVELTQAYISTVMESVPVIIDEGLEDPLENEDSLMETLNMLGQIARCKYEQSSTALLAIFDPIASQYEGLIAGAASGMTAGNDFKEALEMIETKFAWLVYMIAACIGNRSSFLSSDTLDTVDSQLTTKVLQLMNVQQALQTQHGNTFMNEKLDLAFIAFFNQFKKSYMGDSMSGKEIYTKINEVFGINDHVQMLSMIMRKIVGNLQHWGDNEQVVRRTLELFQELANGYSPSKNLRKLQVTQMLLENHMSGQFTFFDHPKQQQNKKLYYHVLCKLLFANDNVGRRELQAFMKPFDMRLQSLGPLDTLEAFQQESVRRTLQDIFTDLCGFITPIQSRREFTVFFDWFYPDYMPVLLRALEAWAPDPIVTSLLFFYAEFVHNKCQRLNFEISSPNGILMFRNASQIICNYGRKIIEQPVTDPNRKYDYKYKGMGLCFSILSRCLGGRYINFGVFWLYQDKCIDNVFNMMMQMLLDIPMSDLMAFPKLSRAFCYLIDELSREQLMALPTISPEAFIYLMQACEQCIESSDSTVRSHACAAVYNIASFLENPQLNPVIEEQRRSSFDATTGSGHWLLNYFTQYPQILPTLLATIFNLVLFDDNNEQWALSRPLYALMVIQREYTMKYINAVIEQQLPERRELVTTALNTLMEGINWTLHVKDRERFTQNISNFRRELNASNVVLVPLVTPP
ncbi:armadillo-type protein [Radiomyces spectabilis]|uniref:armadillo-type protein n=1 Tax=Radiomyces spectabilis TaxID=64574 RepID=UPI00221EC493|nr:armadillo-type protein [Radiomyces spectabilis]KAI8393567.1 armadillo-type protein [Radiomyces spectabilis]